MAARRVAGQRGRKADARARGRRADLWDLLPRFARPNSRAWTHWNRAAVEFLHGVRAALDECIADVERSGRRRAGGRLKRIEVE